MISSSRRALNALGSLELGAALVLVMLLARWLVLRLTGILPQDIDRMLSFRPLALVLCLNIIVIFIRAAIGKKPGLVLVAVGFMLVIGGYTQYHFYWFKGYVGLAQSDQLKRFELVEKGPKATPPEFLFMVTKVVGNPFVQEEGLRSITITTLDGNEFIIPEGKPVWVDDGVRVSMTGMDPAPMFALWDHDGNIKATSYVKLVMDNETGMDYFSIPALPHRFYVRYSGDPEKPVDLTVLRGKLVIARAQLGPSTNVDMEELVMAFPEVIGWARISVERVPGRKLFIGGFALALAGALIMFINSRKKGSDVS